MKYIEFNEAYEKITDNPLLDQILWYNGIHNSDDYHKINTSSFPFYFKNTKIFLDTLEKHKSNKVYVIGDYDCDGVCATAMMIKFLKKININCEYLIGDRFIDGYGMNNSLIDKVIEGGGSLIITVDNGIKCADSVQYAITNNIDCLITDHHMPDEVIPNAPIFNPHYDEDFPFTDMCGAFTAFMLIYSYHKEKKALDKDFLYEMYELSALATIGDVMPLYNINRKIVSLLVSRIQNRQIINSGINALLSKLSSISSSTDIAYRLVPIINAPGRLQNANLIVDILLGDLSNVDKCIALNEERKTITKQTIAKIKIDDERVNVIYQENINEGIIGIVAGSIKERTNRPTFIFTNDNTGEIKGSGRSIHGYNILNAAIEILNKNDLAVRYGGHEGAMGITLRDKNAFLLFKKLINESYQNDIEPSAVCLKYPEMTLNDAYSAIELLEPLGQGLSIPIFKISGTPQGIKVIKNLHTQFQLSIAGVPQTFMAFNKIITKDDCEFYFTIDKSLFNNKFYYKGFVQ